MNREHWRRDKPQFHNLVELPGDDAIEERIAGGLATRTVSRDARSGAATLLVDAPAGWRYRESADDATTEAFVLKGDLSLDGTKVGAAGYVCIPQGCGTHDLSSERGASLLVLSNPNMPLFPPPYMDASVRSTAREPWEETPVPEVVHGIFHRSLRLPDVTRGFQGGPGGYLRWVLTLPGYSDEREHVHHECWEELFLLRGDMYMPGSGVMVPGTYVANPQECWHAPIFSNGGAVLLVHTDGPQAAWTFRDYPNSGPIADEFFDGESWLEPPGQEAWDSERFKHWRERPNYLQWRRDAAGSWATDGVRDRASEFRASWSMTPATRSEPSEPSG